MLVELATSTPTPRTERVAALLRQAQEECQARPGDPVEFERQALLDTVAEVLEGLIRALTEARDAR